MNLYDTGAFQNYQNTNPLLSLQEGYQRHMDQNSLLEQALADNRITEDQYKRMGGYNVLQNAPSYGPIKATPGDVGLASFGYNTAKGAANLFSEDAERGYGDIGFWDSIKKNYQGAKEGLQGDELELYSSITNPRSVFQDDYNIPQKTMGEDTSDLSGMAEVRETIPTANWSMTDDLEAQNVTPTFETSEEEEEYLERVRNMPTIQDEGIPAADKWRNFLSKVTRQPYRGAMSPAGGYSPAQLNKMNALGGFYSEPARQQRRDRSRVANLLARKEAGKPYSQANLNKLTMGSRPGHYDPPGGPATGDGPSSSNMGRNVSPTGRDVAGTPFNYGGRVGYNKGGRVGILSIF